MSEITIAITDSNSPEYPDVWQLREDVLRRPIGLSLKNEDLSMDHEDVILVAKHDGKVIGCLMLHHISNNIIKFRQMAVYNEWQGKQVGRLLMEAAQKYSAEKGYKKVSLHARKVVHEFYGKLGYTTIGAEFEEVGIAHVKMEKEL